MKHKVRKAETVKVSVLDVRAGEGGEPRVLVCRVRPRLITRDGTIRFALDNDTKGIVVDQIRSHAIGYTGVRITMELCEDASK